MLKNEFCYKKDKSYDPCNPCYCPSSRFDDCCKTGPTGPQGVQGPQGIIGPTGPTGPILSSYMEALGNGQVIETGQNIVFDVDSVESEGNNIVINNDGTVFTINKTGFYMIEWDINLEEDTTSAVVGIVENGAGASGATTSRGGNFSSGTIIYVDVVPFTISLHNYNVPIVIVNHAQWINSAASIRIIKFADGPEV